jgi:hypothetical protein
LKDHSNPLAQRDDISSGLEDILTIQEDSPVCSGMWNELVQTVQRPEESRFATSRGTDQGSDLTFSNVDVDVLKGMGGTIIEVKPSAFHFKGWMGCDHRNNWETS